MVRVISIATVLILNKGKAVKQTLAVTVTHNRECRDLQPAASRTRCRDIAANQPAIAAQINMSASRTEKGMLRRRILRWPRAVEHHVVFCRFWRRHARCKKGFTSSPTARSEGGGYDGGGRRGGSSESGCATVATAAARIYGSKEGEGRARRRGGRGDGWRGEDDGKEGNRGSSSKLPVEPSHWCQTYRSNSYARSRARVPWLKPVT